VRRWLFRAIVKDHTGSTWVTMFNDDAEQLLGGVTADVVYDHCRSDSGNHDEVAYKQYFTKAIFSEWIFRCKVRQEMIHEETKISISVIGLYPVNYVKESRNLLALTERL
jgi:replication factor A1